MKINKNKLKKYIWITPAIITFCLALIPTLKYQWPLSWDINYHILIAHIYAKYGLVLTNPLITGSNNNIIGYPPLFQLLIAAIGILTKADFYQIARSLQPILTTFIVLSVTYVGRKFYGTIVGISAGFLIISSLLLGNRLIYPLPENLALIFLPLAVYFYYYSLKEKNFKYATIAGSLFTLILLIHQLAPIVLFTIITAFTIIEITLYRNNHVLKNYGAFLLPPIILSVIGVVGLLILYPYSYMHIILEGIQETTVFATGTVNLSLGVLSYGNLGILTLIFSFIGVISAIIRRQKKDIYLLTWITMIILLIYTHQFDANINGYSYRLLVYLLIPVSILGGFGLTQVYHKLKNYKNFSSHNFRTAFLISIFVLATFDGILTMENPLIAYNGINSQYGTFQIAPPTPSMVELATWFNENGNRSKSIMTNNPFPCTFVTAETGMPLSGDNFTKYNNTTSESYFKENQIGYIVLDKRLTFQSNNETFYRVEYNDEIKNGAPNYPIYYYNGNIQSNLNKILPKFVKIVYENKDFIVCQVQ
jgi:hypothetical protein